MLSMGSYEKETSQITRQKLTDPRLCSPYVVEQHPPFFLPLLPARCLLRDVGLPFL